MEKTLIYPIRLVVSDIDGTLILEREEFPSKIVRLAETLRRRGIAFTFASGRLPDRIDPYRAFTGYDVPAVACNGALVYCGKKIISQHCMPVGPLHTLVTHATQLGMTVLYAVNGLEYCLYETPFTKKKEMQRGSYHPLRPISEEEWKSLRVNKMNIMDESGLERIETLENDLSDIKRNYSVTHYGNSGLEIVCGSVDKAGGVADLCRYLGLQVNQVLAIGDNENDCKMLANAGVGAAVANSDDRVKSCADYICREAGADGVYEAVEKFCLSGEE